MKHLKFFAALCCVAAVFAACEPQDGPDNGQNGNNDQNGANGQEYVDLGLPSGLKWATCNVGATKPEEYGCYYDWGETTTKSSYGLESYKWCNGSDDTQTKYCSNASYGQNGFTDDKIVLELADDVAYANLGGSWRMPTSAEWTELREKCTWRWTTLNGVNGCEVKGTNGNFIFLPVAGIRFDNQLEYTGSYGYYWSSSLYSDDPRSACSVFLESNIVYMELDFPRCYGLSVRAVCE